MAKKTTQSGKKGGLFEGPSHDNGGIPIVVKPTNEPIEVEGGEIIINKDASKLHCKELSKINQSAGNGIAIPCDDTDNIDNTGAKAKEGRFIYPKKEAKTPAKSDHPPKLTFEDEIIGIELKYMDVTDRILTMAEIQSLHNELIYTEGLIENPPKGIKKDILASLPGKLIKIKNSLKKLTTSHKVTIGPNIQPTRNALVEWIKEPTNKTKVIIAFSGGKDSVAMVLHAIYNLGIAKEQIELWHHEVDGHGEDLFDWSCTPSYCQAFADHFELPLLFSYRKDGISGEIQRNYATSQDVYFQKEANGDYFVSKSLQYPKYITKKNMFPAVASDLTKRWCSASAKIQVMSKAINNTERFETGNFVIMTGERRAESKGRSRYNEIEPYTNMSQTRRAITWRSIIDFSEKEVWNLLKDHKVQPHPCYMLGWNRCSCQMCIFSLGPTWKTLLEINPKKVSRIAELEKQNIARNSDIPTLYTKAGKSIGIMDFIESKKEPKEKGVKYPKGYVQPPAQSFLQKENSERWLNEAQSTFTSPIIVEGEWNQPQGAFSKNGEGAN